MRSEKPLASVQDLKLLQCQQIPPAAAQAADEKGGGTELPASIDSHVRNRMKNLFLTFHKDELKEACTDPKAWRSLGCLRFKRLLPESDEFAHLYQVLKANDGVDTRRKSRATGLFVSARKSPSMDSKDVLEIPEVQVGVETGRKDFSRRAFLEALSKVAASTDFAHISAAQLLNRSVQQAGISRRQCRGLLPLKCINRALRRQRQARGRIRGWRKVSDRVLLHRLEPHTYEAGWSVPFEQPKRFLMGSTTCIARRIGVPDRTLRRRVGKGRLGVYRGRLRSGLCSYCQQWFNVERPLLERLYQELIKKVEVMCSTYFQPWYEIMKSKEEFKDPAYDKFSSMQWWSSFFDWGMQRQAEVNNPDVSKLFSSFQEHFNKEEDGKIHIVRGIQRHLQLWKTKSRSLRASGRRATATRCSRPWTPRTLANRSARSLISLEGGPIQTHLGPQLGSPVGPKPKSPKSINEHIYSGTQRIPLPLPPLFGVHDAIPRAWHVTPTVVDDGVGDPQA